jgi:hypothetical protein
LVVLTVIAVARRLPIQRMRALIDRAGPPRLVLFIERAPLSSLPDELTSYEGDVMCWLVDSGQAPFRMRVLHGKAECLRHSEICDGRLEVRELLVSRPAPNSQLKRIQSQPVLPHRERN